MDDIDDDQSVFFVEITIEDEVVGKPLTGHRRRSASLGSLK